MRTIDVIELVIEILVALGILYSLTKEQELVELENRIYKKIRSKFTRRIK